MSDTPPPPTGVVPHLTVNGAADAADWYVRALGAVEVMRLPTPDNARLMHCHLLLNGGALFLADDFPEHAGGQPGIPEPGKRPPVVMHMRVTDCDAIYNRAVDAGATPMMPPADMFWGDRYARLRDPFGHVWSLGQPLNQ